ncbi:DegT/DnrJ/EryC1/StrS family aminotransferase [Nonomuraea sp. NPDC049504]|uniref:DegT/DnrJ/EryC1/StrS family aminotransferase n=1 Tax=Nonomuraea sp. NPDC049504 TaxID=3154729 RepID=UPI0034248B5F
MFERLEAAFASRLGRECLYVPSNRFGIFISLRHWLAPGRRLLMSPISADEILFLVLAAGLRPVIAPIDPRTGNIDAHSLDGLRFDGILTTNLYGLPDDVITLGRVCAEQGIPLIEDAAHAIQTTVAGGGVGTFGDAGIFSLSKAAGAAPGGIVTTASSADRQALQRVREHWLTPRYPATELALLMMISARNAVAGTALAHPAWALGQWLGIHEPRQGHRIPLRRTALAWRLTGTGTLYPGLDALTPWAQADNHHYRMRQGRPTERHALRRLAVLEATRERRLAGVRRLAQLETVAPGVREHLDQPLFRVPLLIEDRDKAIEALRREGVITGYVYDPPFDDYAPGLVEPSPAPAPARWWSRHVLPVDPLQADRAWSILSKLAAPTSVPDT